MDLRVLAIAAPEYPCGGSAIGRLKSADPASLFNACRYAALLAERGLGAWGDSNWGGGRYHRRKQVLLMHSLADDWRSYERHLETIRPNLLLIGAMSLCVPGAVACARSAKERFGDQICIVLGGWHANETIYKAPAGQVVHHPGSPIRLITEGHIDPVLDLVIAGEGEQIIAWIGERIARLLRQGVAPSKICTHLDGVENVAGRWIVAWADGMISRTLISAGRPLRRDQLPIPCEMFGIRSAFDVFENRPTAHVFSDIGSGCIYDCGFCSERRSNTGAEPPNASGAATQLAAQLSAATRVVREDSPLCRASAFVEDSTLLGGSKAHLRQLVELLKGMKLDVRFGAQLTIDQILARLDLLKELKTVGLDYLFIGIETADVAILRDMSKNVNGRGGSWLCRTERVLDALCSLDIACGSAILFGLGESHASRLRLLHQLDTWRQQYGSPQPVSLNWAVQHPLKGADGGACYRYDKWGIPSAEWMDAFADFGEASVEYPIAGQERPVLREVSEIASIYRERFVRPTINEAPNENRDCD